MPAADDLLERLDPEQRDVATALRGPVCVVAGAGTGKTRAITHRIAYGVVTGVYQPQEVLAVTFTTRAAGEMRGRLAQLGAAGVQARTFHSAALRQARYFWPHVYGTQFPEIVRSKFGLVAEAVRRLGLRADTPLLRDLSAEIEWAKVSNIRPGDYVSAATRARREVADLEAAAVGSLMTAYEDVKRERGRIDMEDILLVTAAILADDEQVAAQVRRQYRWFVVDEFQDVNPLQSTLLDLWLGGRDEICVVGDPRQTIYSFAGASPKILESFTRRHPGAERIELIRNYRSTPQVVAVANAVFATKDATGVSLQSQSDPGDPVTYVGHPDETAEAKAVANEIAQLHRRGTPYREIAVLFRINAQSEAFEEALGEHGIPYTLRGVEGFFNRAEVRQAVTLLRGAARGGQSDDEPLVEEVRAVLASMGHTDKAP
ncbi:MAG: ATP-dependent helicase, partial [Actinomycetes bacterium]